MKNNCSRLGLGTVQFGMDYGISNKFGRPDEGAIRAILETANDAGVGVLDTAPSYGDGEAVLGRTIPESANFRIISKTPPFSNDRITDADATMVHDSFKRSLDNLRQSKIYGLLIHHTATLFKPGGEAIVEALLALRSEGLVEKIGVSVYDGNEIDKTLAIFTPDLIQIPISIADQRLIFSGHLSRLKELGIEIHARSLFLQGLLLMKPHNLPSHFTPMKPKLEKMHASFAISGLSPLQGCLAFGRACSELDSLVVGVNRINELRDILSAMNGTTEVDNTADLALDDNFINPALWPT